MYNDNMGLFLKEETVIESELKPYFYHHDSDRDQIEEYRGEIISGEAYGELSGTNLIEEIEAEGYTVGTNA